MRVTKVASNTTDPHLGPLPQGEEDQRCGKPSWDSQAAPPRKKISISDSGITPSVCASMPGKRLLLWDIDGTLISTGAAGQRAIGRATAQRFEAGDLNGVEIAGRTDVGIGRQILSKYGAPVNDENVHSFLDLYVELLA